LILYVFIRGTTMAGSSKAAEDGIDHCLRLVIVKGAVPGEQSKDHRSVDQVEDNLPINFFPNLASVNAAPPHYTRRVPSGVQKSLSKQRQKSGIALALRNELAEQPSKRRLVECRH
jgi:hypothetical protein